MEIQENAFTEALLDDIEDQWENFLNQASCHFHPELEALTKDLDLVPVYEDDVLPF